MYVRVRVWYYQCRKLLRGLGLGLLTLLIWVYAVASVEFLMSLLFQDSFAKDGILVDNVDRLLFFLLLTGSRHFDY